MDGMKIWCSAIILCGILTVNAMPRRNVLMMMIPKNGDGMPKVIAFPRHMIDSMVPRQRVEENYRIEELPASVELEDLQSNGPMIEQEMKLPTEQEVYVDPQPDLNPGQSDGLSDIEAKMTAMENMIDEMKESMSGPGYTADGDAGSPIDGDSNNSINNNNDNDDNNNENDNNDDNDDNNNQVGSTKDHDYTKDEAPPIQINFSGGCEDIGMFLPFPNDSCMFYACRYGPEPWRTGNVFNVIKTALPCPHGLAVADGYKGGYGNPCTVPSQRCSQPKNSTSGKGGYSNSGSSATDRSTGSNRDSEQGSSVSSTSTQMSTTQAPTSNDNDNNIDDSMIQMMQERIRQKMMMIERMMEDLRQMIMDLQVKDQVDTGAANQQTTTEAPATIGPAGSSGSGSGGTGSTTGTRGQGGSSGSDNGDITTGTGGANDDVEDHTYPPEDIPFEPSGKCMMLGQYLPVPGSECYYYRCVYGRDPEGGNVSIQPKMMRCPSTLSVPATYEGSMYSPCTRMSFKCKVEPIEPTNSTTTAYP